MSSDPKKIVDEYLNKNGYAFEMRVAQELKKAGFRISQSYYYQDANENIARELDILALYHKKVDGISFYILLPIECKYAKTPWILFKSELAHIQSSLSYSSNILGREWAKHLFNQLHFENFFELEKSVGYGLVTSSNDDDLQKNNAYKSIQTLLSFLKGELKDRGMRPNNERFCAIYIPIIAIKGKLFSATLDNDNSIISTEINQAQLYYKENIGEVLPKINILTEYCLHNYAKRLYEDCEWIFIEPYMSKSLINQINQKNQLVNLIF